MERKTFWLIMAICETVTGILALLNGLIKSGSLWFRVTEFIMSPVLIFFAVYFWVKFYSATAKKDKTIINDNENEDLK